MNDEAPPILPKSEEGNTAFMTRAIKIREEMQQTEFRNWLIFLIVFTLCLETVRGKEISEPFYGICYAAAGFITGAAITSKDKLKPPTS